MTEEPSPASTSGTSGNQSDTSSPQSRNGREPRLVILKHPPAHVFAREWFDVEVGLEALRGFGSPTRSIEAEFVTTLVSVDLEEIADQSMLTVEPARIHLSTLSTPSKRHQAIRCRINASGAEGSSFVIRISPKTEVNGLRAVTTRGIMIARLKLDIKEKQGWESVWYKDEGGRDKCMMAVVGLYNRNDRLVTGEKVPLQLKLCYDNKDEPVHVSRQEIFRMIGSTRHHIDKKTGTAVLRFRIEDVSKNHQGQEFRVEASPDPKTSGVQDIAPAYTPAVSVRSKRNKRQRGGPGKTEVRGPSPVGGRPPPPFPRSASYPGDDSTRQESLAGADVPRLREAMKGVISWTDDVVNGLYPLQWYIIGYAQNPDGTPDYNRPYHSMPNPNATISRVLSTYSESTRENLRVLLAAIEKSGPGSQIGSPYTPAGTGMPDDRFASIEGSTQPMLPPPMDSRMPPLQAPFGSGTGSHQPGPAEGYGREKRDSEMTFGGQPGLGMPMRGQPPHLMYPPAGLNTQPSGPGTMPMHPGEQRMPPTHLRQGKTTGMERGTIQVHETQRAQRPFEEESRESEVEYVIAKQFKALRTGERLGFPAYSANKELLGFYRESSMTAGVGQFVPISRHQADFGHMEIMQATEILEEAMASKSEAFHALKDWGSISNLVDHALVYDWTKDMGGNNNSS